MWIIFAFASAFFAGLTAILSKIGIKNVDSNVATAVRTVVVLIFSWLMVALIGSFDTIGQIPPRSMLFLILSGLATGASWLCYFKALHLGDVNKVTPIDKSSTLFTMLLAMVFLKEEITLIKGCAMILIAIGTFMMIEKRRKEISSSNDLRRATEKNRTTEYSWMAYAFAAAIFAALTSILGKIGIEGVESNLGTAIRTVVVLIMAWLVVFVNKKQNSIKQIGKKSLLFLVLSGFATGGSWLCYYRALQTGPASIVVPIDKLSILLTIAFSYFILKEKLSKKALVGLALIVVGTLSMLL